MHIYEKAFRESIHLCLTIEREWLLIHQSLNSAMSSVDGLHVLDRLIHLMHILERSDAKVKLLQELSRCYARFEEGGDHQMHEGVQLSVLKEKCNEVSRGLTISSRILSRVLMSDPFLSKFYYNQEQVYHSIYAEIWSKQPSASIKEQMHSWLKQLECTWYAVEMILWLTRSGGQFKDIMVASGFHKEDIKQDVMSLSLVRVKRQQPDLFPSLSLVQHWLVITVYQMKWFEQVYHYQQVNEETPLSIVLCK